MCDVLEACVDAGARTIKHPDTVGYAIPREWGERIARIQERLKAARGQLRALGPLPQRPRQAVANSLTGVMNGARQVECTSTGSASGPATPRSRSS